MFDLPEGAKDSDPRWQSGYEDGEMKRRPASDDPVYVSGWCHGWCGWEQSTAQMAEDAYRKAIAEP